jgi:hypothetical protein
MASVYLVQKTLTKAGFSVVRSNLVTMILREEHVGTGKGGRTMFSNATHSRAMGIDVAML